MGPCLEPPEYKHLVAADGGFVDPQKLGIDNTMGCHDALSLKVRRATAVWG